MGKSIGILSLKGGVGKTSIVSSLGAAISEFQKKVLLVDANLSAPNLGLHFNIVDPEVTLHHVLAGLAHIKDSIHNLKNFDLIPASMFERKKVNALKLKDKLKDIKNKYDTILIDSSPALNEETLAAMLASDSLLIATTPDYPTLGTTLKAIKIAKQRGTPIDGLILNKVHNKNFELSLKEIEDTADVPIMAVIPHDLSIMEAQSKFTSPSNHRPKSKASEEYRRLAATLVGEKYKPPKVKRFFRWINLQKQEVNRQTYYNRVFN